MQRVALGIVKMTMENNDKEKVTEGGAKLAFLMETPRTPATTRRPLFSNRIDTERAFGMPRGVSDNLNRLIDEITPQTVKENFRYGGKTFKGKNGVSALRVVDKEEKIKTHEDFYRELARIKDAKVIQTYMVLNNYCNEQGSYIFSGTRLTEIMRTVLKTKSGYFTQPQKREFTEAIHRLRKFEIYLDQPITDTDDKGRKQKVIKRDFYKLIDLEGATYAKRKQDLIDAKTGRVIYKKGDADESVIIKLYGELLPGYNKGVMRGRLYSKGLLELDANKDGRAVILGFRLSTRFDQLRQGKEGDDKNLYIQVDRKTLIEWTDYTQTDLEDKWIANQYLTKTLDKLVKVNCLRDYQPRKLTTNDDLKITLYPSRIALTPPVKDDQTLKEKNKRGG